MMLLRTTSTLLLALASTACGTVLEPPAEDTSGTTQAAADSSSGGSLSATSSPGSTGSTGMLDPSFTSTAAVDTSATVASGDETASSFLVIPDGGICVYGGGAPEGFEVRCSQCDVILQECPEGDKCVPWANDGGDVWNATRCSPVPEDPRGVGEPCIAEGSPVSGFDNCALGALCFGVDPRTLLGTCAALCDEYRETTCGTDELCVTHDYYRPYVCLPRCDPFDPGTCLAGETCRPIGDDLLCVPDVTLPQGLDCGVADQFCAADQACLWADELASCAQAQCCTPYCDLSAPDPDLPCAAVPGEVCRPFFDAPPAGYEHVGVCGLP